MITSPKTALAAVVAASSVGSGSAFTPQSFVRGTTKGNTRLFSTVDPTVVTKKEYQDICGVDFDDSTMAERLEKTAYLYPKHVEVIEDFAPMVDKMVDEIVSRCIQCVFIFCCCYFDGSIAPAVFTALLRVHAR